MRRRPQLQVLEDLFAEQITAAAGPGFKLQGRVADAEALQQDPIDPFGDGLGAADRLVGHHHVAQQGRAAAVQAPRMQVVHAADAVAPLQFLFHRSDTRPLGRGV
jgi:hypothetical protein